MVWRYCSVNDTFKSIYEHWAGNEGKSLGEVTNRSSHCLVMLQFPPRPPFHEIFVLSHPGNEDSCYGKHTKEPAWWTQLILTITGFHQPIAIFKETMQTDKGGEGRKRALRARSNFNQQGRALRLIRKWQKKTTSLLNGCVSLLSPWHNQRGWEAFSLCCEVNALRTKRAQLV